MRYNNFDKMVDTGLFEIVENPLGLVCPTCGSINTKEDWDNCDMIVARCLLCNADIIQEVQPHPFVWCDIPLFTWREWDTLESGTLMFYECVIPGGKSIDTIELSLNGEMLLYDEYNNKTETNLLLFLKTHNLLE